MRALLVAFCFIIISTSQGVRSTDLARNPAGDAIQRISKSQNKDTWEEKRTYNVFSLQSENEDFENATANWVSHLASSVENISGKAYQIFEYATRNPQKALYV